MASSVNRYDFVNPYDFVRVERDPERCDRRPFENTHESFHRDCFSGRLTCSLKVETPLFIPDPEETLEAAGGQPKRANFFRLPESPGEGGQPAREEGQAEDACRVTQGTPAIPPASLKGMVRSVLEAVSDSCFSVLQEDERLTYRADARLSQHLRPAVVVHLDEEKREAKVVLFDGRREIAWLPTGRFDGRNYVGAGYKSEPTTLDDIPQCSFRLVYAKMKSVGRRQDGNRIIPSHWVVTAPLSDSPYANGDLQGGEQQRQVLVKCTYIPKGPSNPGSPSDDALASNKHDERVIFSEVPNYQMNLQAKLENQQEWEELPYEQVEDCNAVLQVQYDLMERSQSENGKQYAEREIRKRLNRASGPMRLQVNDIVYVHSPPDGQSRGLALVLVPRLRYRSAISDLIPPHLHPCSDSQRLCPACRMFGRVDARGAASFRGKVTFSLARLKDPHLPWFRCKKLKALLTPHPTAVNFYLMKDETSTDAVMVQNGGYEGAMLRGRKFYWHQGNEENPLDESRFVSKADDPVPDRLKIEAELLFPDPNGLDVAFEFTIDFENLTRAELALLVWSVELEDAMYHKLGMGKPLGLGTVKVAIDRDREKSFMFDFDAFTNYYQNLDHAVSDAKKPVPVDALIGEAGGQYGASSAYRDLTTIMAFHPEVADLVKYPAARTRNSPELKGYAWFARNRSQPLYRIGEIVPADGAQHEGVTPRRQNNWG